MICGELMNQHHKVITDSMGTIKWYNSSGQLHYGYGLPAVIYANGIKEYWIDGILDHIEYPNGNKEYLINGKFYNV